MTDLIVSEIEDEALMKGRISREITTSELGELVLARLSTVDKVAYIRFASVYKKFTDVTNFLSFLKNLGA